MNVLPAALVGLLAGLHTATWGMYKDSPHEGFTWRTYLRSVLLSTLIAIIWQLARGFDLAAPAGRVLLFGLTYVTERGLVELYKTFLREEDQSKYTIPMQFHVFGRVVHDRGHRLAVALGWAVVVAGISWWLHHLPRTWGTLLAVGSIGGWLSACGGAFKDAPIEGFDTFKFFRSPVLALLWSLLAGYLGGSILESTLCGLGYTVASAL